jgi:hypothetical protein
MGRFCDGALRWKVQSQCAGRVFMAVISITRPGLPRGSEVRELVVCDRHAADKLLLEASRRAQETARHCDVPEHVSTAQKYTIHLALVMLFPCLTRHRYQRCCTWWLRIAACSSKFGLGDSQVQARRGSMVHSRSPTADHVSELD